jgi:hypothetical protein
VSTKSSKTLSIWWHTSGRRFALAQWVRLVTGSALGCVAAGLAHLLTEDSSFVPRVEQWWAKLPAQTMFDGVKAYRLELVALGVVLTVGIAPWLIRAFRRYIRAWWAGITSLTTVFSAILVVSILRIGTAHPLRSLSFFILLILVVACELWRMGAFNRRAYSLPKLAIPTQKRRFSAQDSRTLTSSDDPIQDWDQDIIGRASIVEILAQHIFVQRTPIIALDGERGDGKSSVLNLLRRAIDGHAIIVSFSAWLPGSHETLALDLFRDIATECRRALYMPQIRKASIAYARTITGSVSFLAGLKEILPSQSQREEIEEIRDVLGRVPVPIAVLLDEVDRMQRDELLVLLKILRGASSMPNVTFVCAFSEREVRKMLSEGRDVSNDYFEKFFPAKVNLAPPDPKMLGMLFQRQIISAATSANWFLGTDEKKFRELLEYMWEQSLSQICTNLRKLRLLLNDVMTAAWPIAGEVNAFDFVGIESLQRFEPAIHRLISKNSAFLTRKDDSWSKGGFADREKSAEAQAFYTRLEAAVSESTEPAATRALLDLLFPRWSSQQGERSRHSFVRSVRSDQDDEAEKRICSPDYFFIYFRAALPEEMYSEAELSRIVARLNQAKTEEERIQIFSDELLTLPKGHPRREDFLWKIGRSVQTRLTEDAAEGIACAAAIRASDYAYDIMNIGEAARALNIVYEAAQKTSSTSRGQSILLRSMKLAADDTFALRLLEFTEHKDRNKILNNFSHIDPQVVRTAFLERMRARYGKAVDALHVNILQGDWRAFKLWADNSSSDKEAEQDFLRRFIGSSRKRLGQALGFLFPAGYTWSDDPRPLIDNLFPLAEAQKLIESLADDGVDELESKNIKRYKEMLGGKWFNIDNPNSWHG